MNPYLHKSGSTSCGPAPVCHDLNNQFHMFNQILSRPYSGGTISGNHHPRVTQDDAYMVSPQLMDSAVPRLNTLQGNTLGSQFIPSSNMHRQSLSGVEIRKTAQHQLPKTTMLNNVSTLSAKLNSQGAVANKFVYSDTVQNDSLKQQPLEAIPKSVGKIPDLTQVKKSTDSRVKQGDIVIQLSDKFFPMNMTGKKMFDIVFMRQFFDISKVSISLSKSSLYADDIIEAVKTLIRNNLLVDWFILKCEEKQLGLFQVTKDVIVYSVNNFSTLVNLIAQESCLPLPFITRDRTEKQNMLYFFLTIAPIRKDKIKKLNFAVFYDADNGRKKYPCRYAGIRLDCSFEKTIEQFNFHVQESVMNHYTQNATRIRQLLVYKHIVWGYLQAWTRRIWEHYNKCFKHQEIAANLSLYRAQSEDEISMLLKTSTMIYPIDYMNYYIKFDPVVLKDSKACFSIENFETNYVCDVNIVQYYRQFFLVNDVHYSDALNNVLLFSEWNVKGREVCNIQDRGGTSSVGRLVPRSGPKKPSSVDQKAADVNGKSSVSESISACSNARSNPLEKDCSRTKPLIKARTVEEINSCLDIDKLLEPTQATVTRKEGVNVELLTEADSCLNNNNWQEPVRETVASCVNEEVTVKEPRIPDVVRKLLDQCFVKRSMGINSTDDTGDAEAMKQYFYEAVRRSANVENLESFINTLYIRLQVHFTNSTCEALMNKMICQALESVPHLKHVLEEGPGRERQDNDDDIAIALEERGLQEERLESPVLFDDDVTPAEFCEAKLSCNVPDVAVEEAMPRLIPKTELYSCNGEEALDTRDETPPPPVLTPMADPVAEYSLNPCYVRLERLDPEVIRRYTKRPADREPSPALKKAKTDLVEPVTEKSISNRKSGEVTDLKMRSKKTGAVGLGEREAGAIASDVCTERVKEMKSKERRVKGGKKEESGTGCKAKKSRMNEGRKGEDTGAGREMQDDRDEDEESKKKRLRAECLERCVRVNLVRLEETPLFGLCMSKLEKSRSEDDSYFDTSNVDSDDADDDDYSATEDENYNIEEEEEEEELSDPASVRDVKTRQKKNIPENVPQDKRRFFEMRDGVLYLRDGYMVLNGRIVSKSCMSESKRMMLRHTERNGGSL